MAGDSPILTEQERRLRGAENKIVIFEQRVEQVLQAVEEIKEAVRDLTSTAASRDNLSRLETSITSAHSRLDSFNKEFWKLQTEHVTCQRSNEAMSTTLANNNNILADIQGTIKLLDKSVNDLTEAKSHADAFWTTRLGTVMDKTIQLLPWLLTMAYLHFKLGS